MRRRRKNESGFALLLVFLMGAVLAVTLYKEIPRVAFETQRQKELLLIERGEQYKRAIQLFFKDQKRFPTRIEELETTNNKHFLRRRYIDPMTGKDEWRVIRMVNGVLTDSKVQKPQNAQQKQGPTSTYIGEVAGLGQTLVNQGQSAANPGLRRRGSDNIGPGGPGVPGMGDPNAPGMPPQQPGNLPPGMTGPTGMQGQPGVPGQPGQPGSAGIAGVPQGFPGATGQPGVAVMPGQMGATGPSGLVGRPGATGTGQQQQQQTAGSSYLGGGSSYLGGGSTAPTSQQGNMPPNVIPGQPGMPPGGAGFPPGVPANSQNFGGTPAYPTQPGANGPMPGLGGQPGMSTNPQAQNAAAQMIGQILTQPRPGGMPQVNAGGMAVGGNGIAGFASNADQDSIIVYNDQTNYSMWEFIFDPAKVKPLMNPGGGNVGTPASQMGGPNGQQIGTPMNSPFGGQQNSPFGRKQ